jgi:hypothetical protein
MYGIRCYFIFMVGFGFLCINIFVGFDFLCTNIFVGFDFLCMVYQYLCWICFFMYGIPISLLDLIFYVWYSLDFLCFNIFVGFAFLCSSSSVINCFLPIDIIYILNCHSSQYIVYHLWHITKIIILFVCTLINQSMK